jgi:hypothetical protein
MESRVRLRATHAKDLPRPIKMTKFPKARKSY